jgi:hypothetical protein
MRAGLWLAWVEQPSPSGLAFAIIAIMAITRDSGDLSLLAVSFEGRFRHSRLV